MNASMMIRRGLALGVSLWACMGCIEGVIGVDPVSLHQGANGDIVIPSWDVEDVKIQPLSELSLDWVKRLPGPIQAAGSGPNAAYYRVLQADHAGKLVLFFLDESTQALNIARLSDTGDIMQQASVAPPEGWKGGADTRIGFGSCGAAICNNDPLGIKASWWKESSDPSASSESWTMQKLIFDADITKDPKRKTLTNGVVDDLLLTTDNDLYAITADPGHNVTKQSATGRLLWKAEHLEEGAIFGANSPAEGRRLFLSGVALNDGSLVVMTQPDGDQNCYVTFFDADGVRTNTQTFLNNARYLLSAGDHAVSIGPYDSGDLLVLGLLDPAHNKGVKFIREDYTLLYPETAAIDPSGNVYFGTHNGSRLGAVPMLCRAAASGGGNCYSMPLHNSAGSDEFRFDDIVARDNGELYIRSGYDLVHVSYPK